MSGIDRIIASPVSTEIKKNLELDSLKKIERELFLDSGMSIKLSIEHFDNFMRVFKNDVVKCDVPLFKTEHSNIGLKCSGFSQF